jgi:EVE domain
MAMKRKNWIAVASAEHARRGRDDPKGGFMQVGHGKLAPLKRISAGDRIAYYAPTIELGRPDKLQCFVSIGAVHGDTPYEANMGNEIWATASCHGGETYVTRQRAKHRSCL